MNENDCISIQISLKFVPWYITDKNPALVQLMIWCQTRDKPFPEPMLSKIVDGISYRMATMLNKFVIFFKMKVWSQVCLDLKVSIILKCSGTSGIESVLWMLMAWCFSTRASVATMLTYALLHLLDIPAVWGLTSIIFEPIYSTRILGENSHRDMDDI